MSVDFVCDECGARSWPQPDPEKDDHNVYCPECGFCHGTEEEFRAMTKEAEDTAESVLGRFGSSSSSWS